MFFFTTDIIKAVERQPAEREKTFIIHSWQKNLYQIGKEFLKFRNSLHGSVETNLTSIHEDARSIPGLPRWVKDPALLWAVV